ncbi:glycoside hydrolase family 88 protein [Anabaena sp. CCY 9614]|uniref:glycoside hydrolase family 88 protein n=2 Tax=unclassified Anabaena TaxID=2619674 RepID=UPI0039C63FF7
MNNSMEWLQAIAAINNQELIQHKYNFKNRFLDFIPTKIRNNHNHKTYDERWPMAVNALGAIWYHKLTSDEHTLIALKQAYNYQINQNGNWKKQIESVPQAMKGYSLIYLDQITQYPLYKIAIEEILNTLLFTLPRELDGCLPYNKMNQNLVDTLGMICPFLAKYSSSYGNSNALELSLNQLKQFIEANIDSDTHLPYHGYYADGAKRLGMHGWGRGTGWYILGLIDTIVEVPKNHPNYCFLVESYISAANSLRKFQREDGHWNWAIPLRVNKLDSSATSFIGYSILRGIKAGILDNSFSTVTEKAIKGIIEVTHPNGLIDGSLSDCMGLGLYPNTFGPQPWLQGMATAFGSLYFAN